MAAVSQIEGVCDFLKQKIGCERKTYEEISQELRRFHPGTRGLSARSVRRFCADNDITPICKLTEPQLDCVVASSIAKVCAWISCMLGRCQEEATLA